MTNQISAFCKENKVSQKDFTGKTRKSNIVQLRFIFFYLIREKYNYTYECIGAYFGRTHAAVLYGVKVIRDKYLLDERINILVKINRKLI